MTPPPPSSPPSSPYTTPHARAALIKHLAHDLGFDLVGIAPAEPSRWADSYRAWLAAGQHGNMQYLAQNVEERLNIHARFPWAKTVIAVALAYYQEEPAPADGATPTGKIARYAWGRDYHRVIRNKLTRLEKSLRSHLSPDTFEARHYCDTGPLLDREWALGAGLGWIGKHTLLIHPQHGSWFLLGEMITSLELPPDDEIPDHCGTCRRCIDACPTHAITPYHVDATKCISYHTLENRGEIPEEIKPPMAAAGFVVGCDICQQICPHNHAPLPTHEPDFAPQSPAPAMSLNQIMTWSEHDWDQLTRGHAHRRARHDMWQRNAQILLSKPQ